ncbi:MAG TPA: OmpA family protein [Burkholderiaceae bacterium]|jgi:OOP family OmpA-OmpF porin
MMTSLHLRSVSVGVLAVLATAVTTAAGAADPAPVAAVEQVSVRSTAHFDFNKASVRLDDQATLLAEVAKMKDVTWQAVTATGHTDSIGSVAYNRRLADRRAEAVKAFLVGKGVDGAIIDTGEKAAQAPVAPNDTSTGRAKNRRTEVVFQGVRASTR